jgi:tRNA (guanine-N(7)-)-methyltransferase subunit TRM82
MSSRLFDTGGMFETWISANSQQEPQPKDADAEGPPEKKVKLSEPPKQKKANFTNLIVTSDGRHIVAVTGEDKCIRVFDTNFENQLRQLSER